jgi:predicted dehydrogenase
MSKLRVGVIGVGGIARTHMPGWAASEHAEVVAGSDVSAEALARWGQEHGVTKLHADPEALFNDADIDVIDVCTLFARSPSPRHLTIFAA